MLLIDCTVKVKIILLYSRNVEMHELEEDEQRILQSNYVEWRSIIVTTKIDYKK